ncbi:uncharacterized protein LOC127530657 [Acanthochromis polyacanthus]|uniref:uncharacterized protein LOC127530657 n=1 Tax=Acanthochromis polyacanthus TaxID=80966 RepID=UPI00223491DD|nr:uncharacterized protein LOC127530657 [Acanthochromis polyacanthus]
MDDSYIWQRRIVHGIRHQKGAVPFPESVKIGVEFNAALERKDKLDQNLLTNAVMLEICSFAKTVTKSEKYFLFEILELNFELGVDVEDGQQCYAYSLRVYNKIKLLREQIRLKPGRWREPFTLPDPNFTSVYGATSEVLRQYYPKHNRTANISLLTDGSNNLQKAGGVSRKRRGFQGKPKEDVFPFCAELGVSLIIQPDQTPKPKLDPNFLTNGVMLELLDFSRQLCGTHTHIVFDLVKQNFGLELNRMLFRVQFNKMVEKKNACLMAEDKDTFFKEVFSFQPEKKRQKRKRPDIGEQEVEILSSQRRSTLRQRSSGEPLEDGDLSYMCPVDSEPETEPKLEAEDNLSEDVKQQQVEEVKQEDVEEEDMKQEEDVKQQEEVEDVEQQQEEDMEEEDVKQEEEDVFISSTQTNDLRSEPEKQKLWQRRAARSEKILAHCRVNDQFSHCREIGLDFSVCSSRKQNLDLQLFTNRVLWEVYKFGGAMKKSLRHFLFEILLNNFNLPLQDETQERNFMLYLSTKQRLLQNHSDREEQEFLSRPFRFPRVYNVSFKEEKTQEQEQQQQEEQQQQQQQEEQQEEEHPFCKKLGLNLWSTEEQPANQRLDLGVLTCGAVLEMFSFVRQLCGNVHTTVSDVLEHNFDLDLQSGRTELAQRIHRWFITQQSLMKKQRISKVNLWLNTTVPLNEPTPSSDLHHPHPQDSELDVKPVDVKPVDGGEQRQDRLYHICQQIGLDLDLSCRPEPKAKLDLQLLTRAVLLEVHRYVEHNCNRYVPALYEILEHNFDLSSQSHRRVEFAWSIASQVIAMAAKHSRKEGYLNAVFQLPFEDRQDVSKDDVCKDEPDDHLHHPELSDSTDIVFVRKLKPVDIEVEID